MNTIGKAIKKLRLTKGMTQEELAEASGLSSSYISLIESDDRTPRLVVLYAIAEVLGVPLKKLVEEK